MPNRALALCVSCMVDSGAFHMTVCYSRLLYIFTCMRKGGRRGEGGRGEREGREGGGGEGTPPLFSLYEISAVKEVISDPNQCAYCVPQCL